MTKYNLQNNLQNNYRVREILYGKVGMIFFSYNFNSFTRT